jgi:hypothetical protein
MMPTIVESKRKKSSLLLDNYRYTQDKIVNTTTYWKCSNRSCSGRALQQDSGPPKMTKPYNHEGNEIQCKIEEFKMNLKRRIEDSPQPVKKIYREQIIALHTTSPQITPFTPMFHEMKTSLYNARNASYPPVPRNVDDVKIEGIWSKTLNGELFVLNTLKHPIFGTLESLKQLSKSEKNHLFFDGTFKSCPNPFYQLYSVHSLTNDLSTPKLYTLLSDKRGPTYISMFNSILNLCYTNDICLNPSFVTIDFEQAAINSIRLIFPNAVVKGCNFHFNKCIYTKLQELGFQSAFIDNKSSDINDINIRNLYKKTCVLAFMPTCHHGKNYMLIEMLD